MDVYWWLSALTEYVYCPACWIILPHPWGKLIKTQPFGKQHFMGFCENFQFLILPRICSQKIKDSQSRLKNSSVFMVSPPRSQKKGGSLYPTFPYLGNGWTDCAQICYVSRDRYDMWLRQRIWGVSARAPLHTPPLFRVLAWIGWFKLQGWWLRNFWR